MFLLLTISVFYLAIQVQALNISQLNGTESAIISFFALALLLAFFAMIDTLVKNSNFVLRRIVLIFVYYIILAFVGAAYYTFLQTYESGVTYLSEMILFLIPVGFIVGHFLFTPFDKKISSINEISLTQQQAEAEQKKEILQKIERTTGMDLSGNEKRGDQR